MSSVSVISNRHIQNGRYFKNPEDLYSFINYFPEMCGTLIFAFWSWKVPPHVLAYHKCYGLHTGPLLEGRGKGGSPIDNLMHLNVQWTTLCSFQMTEEIDGGKVMTASPLYIGGKWWSKENVIKEIDAQIPDIVSYLTEERPEIPEKFERIKEGSK